MWGAIDPRRELVYETVFLVMKAFIELKTGKFGWELLLHHSAMVLGFLFNQHPSMQCWAFITVHQQFVHFPFAIRAMWRLTLPAFGYIKTEMSWRRRGLVNLFWVTWMFSCGYRTTLICAYSTWALIVRKEMTWQPLFGYFFALVLGSLDWSWTKAMWPKAHQVSPVALHEYWFHIGTRLSFLAGFIYGIVALLADVAPDLLPADFQYVYARRDEMSMVQCLAGTP